MKLSPLLSSDDLQRIFVQQTEKLKIAIDSHASPLEIFTLKANMLAIIDRLEELSAVAKSPQFQLQSEPKYN